MCNTCGCNVTPGNQHLLNADSKLTKAPNGNNAITVLKNLLIENDQQATHNRAHFDSHGVLALNLMSSPGAGKTRLLEATIDALKSRYRIAVIEGDLETENDAARIRAKGVTAVQISTGTACHLDAHMLHDALHELDLKQFDIVFIENVGNLVCPASFDLGHHYNVTLLSVTEGDDKPAKYPVMFRASDLLILSKIDLLPLLDDFDADNATRYLRQLANQAPVIALSANKRQGMDLWLHWLDDAVLQHREKVLQGSSVFPASQSKQSKPQHSSHHHPSEMMGHSHV